MGMSSYEILSSKLSNVPRLGFSASAVMPDKSTGLKAGKRSTEQQPKSD